MSDKKWFDAIAPSDNHKADDSSQTENEALQVKIVDIDIPTMRLVSLIFQMWLALALVGLFTVLSWQLLMHLLSR